MSEAQEPVMLGFVEPFDEEDPEDDARIVELPNFESKVGGMPQWLVPQGMPGSERLRCSCGAIKVFLMQVYAPLEMPHAHHRFIYVFACAGAECWSEGTPVTVLRCQLPLLNEHYPSDTQERLNMDPVNLELCAVCGIQAPHRCGKCHTRRYCSREHQKLHWKSHKEACCNVEQQEDAPLEKSLLFPVMEIVTDREVLDEAPRVNAEDGTVQPFHMEKDQYDEMDKEVAERIQLDKTMMRFQERIFKERSQVLRYSRGASSPLWVYDQDQLEDISSLKCNHCEGPLLFEFQVLPQLLFYLDSDGGMDWGTIVIYTCANSCADAPPYATECVWIQRPH